MPTLFFKTLIIPQKLKVSRLSEKLLRFAGRTILKIISVVFDEFSSGYNIGNL